ncbi:hypothetical protein EOD39_1268 [Acipenser ruthenus]|uniref:Shelterin complex subunit TPP1/Est3 domain-containing protein n=1 Tax=Acipenser ruthenus TaxID=7906 RepID=A0A444UEF7_ACIRT|nr:hypothetical protein EOD39_1268 [Acipenser ruthenus]
MAFITSSVVWPWIVKLLETYGNTEGRLRPVQAQVIEFGDLADYTHEGKGVAAALVNISDYEFYIPAVITLQAKQLLEEEEDHYDLSNLKNKDIVLRNYRVAFQDAAEECKCEFFIVIENFRILPKETQTANVCSWSRVRKDDMNDTAYSESEPEPDEQTHAGTSHDPWSEIPSMDISFSSAGTQPPASPPEAQNKEEGVQAAALHSSPPVSLKLPTALPWSNSLPSQLGTQQADNPNSTLQLFTDSSSCTREPAEKMATVASGQRVLEHESIKASITSYQKHRHANVSPVPSSSMLPSGRAQASGGSLPGTTVIPRDRSVTPSLFDRWSPTVAASSSDEEVVLRSKPAKRKCQVVDSDSEEIVFNTDDEDVVRAPEIVNPRRKQVQPKPCLTFLNAEKAAKNTVTAGKAAKNTVTAGKATLGEVAKSCKEQTVTYQQVSKASNKNGNTSGAGDLQKPAVVSRTLKSANKSHSTAGMVNLEAVAKSCKEQTVTNQQVSKASNKNGSASGAGDLHKPAVVSRTLKSANKSHSTAGMVNLEAVAKSCKEQTVTNQQVSKASNKNGSTSGTRDRQKTAMKHRDGTSFMYDYEPPSAELVKRINSLRVPDSLLIWAWQYIAKPD